MQFKSRRNQSGQAVLIVLLSLSVVLVVVLYIMSRSVTDISLSSKEDDSMRAFSAAEAGIERALVIGSDIGSTVIGDARFTADVSSFGSGQTVFTYPLGLKSGEIATFWFNRPAETSFVGNQVKVCWGAAGSSNSTSTTPAVEIAVYYKSTTNIYNVLRTVLDPNSGRTVTNKFGLATTSACSVNGENFAFQTTVNFATLGIANYATAGALQYMTVMPLYNDTVDSKIGIDVSGTGSLLPSQGQSVSADGTSGSSSRRIEVYQLHPVTPPVFMNAIYSSTGITK